MGCGGRKKGGTIARLVGSSCHFAHLDLTAAAPGCAGIDQNGERVGAAAVDLVVEQLHANEFGLPQNPKTVLIEGRWVADFCRKRPKRTLAAAERVWRPWARGSICI